MVFVGQDGQPMTVMVNGRTYNGTLDFNLLYRSCSTFTLTGGSQTKIGWIIVTQLLSDSTTKGSINGVLTFRYKIGGAVVSQVGVPAARDVRNAHLPFDNTGGRLSAFAVVSFRANTLDIARYDEQGVLQETKRVVVPALNQQALFVHELFPNSINRAGFIAISGTDYLNFVALNVNNSNWSSSAVLPAVLERQITVTGSSSVMPARLVMEGQFIHGVLETSPGLVSPITGVVTFPPTGGMILYLHMSSFIAATGEAVMAVASARIADLKMLNVQGKVTYIYEDGSTQDGGSFNLYPLSTAQF